VLAGGHTGEGSELALGFAVVGLVDDASNGAPRNGGMRPGDVLILTKPIGTGTLLAAHARLLATGRWIDAALDSMQVSNRAAAACLHAHGATACTSVAGLGLYGHLLEMTRAAAVNAELDLDALPLLPGAPEMAAAGVGPPQQTPNAPRPRAPPLPEGLADHPCLPLLYDPQIAGGLLASVPVASAQRCLDELHRLGYAHAVVVGRAVAQRDGALPIRLVG
jgi:selenide,water dikinase